jgi:dynein heavy chain
MRTGSVRQRPNPAASWLQEPSWQQLLHLSAVPAYTGITDAVAADPAAWREVYNAADPQKASLPGHYSRLSEFRKLLVLRCVCLHNDIIYMPADVH